MTLNYVTLTLDLYDGQGNPVIAGSAAFTPSAVLTDAGAEIIGQQPIAAVFHAGGLPTVKLLATDNSGPAPSGWTWSVTFAGITGAPAAFSFFLPYTGGASQLLSNLIPVSSGTAFQAYMPLPAGTAQSGQVPVATGAGETSAWGTPAAGIQPPAGDIGGSTGSPTVVSTHLSSALPVAQGGSGTALQEPGTVPGYPVLLTAVQWALVNTDSGFGQKPLTGYTYANGTAGVGATITSNSNGALSIDSGTPVLGDRVVVIDPYALGTGNPPHVDGIYTVTATGSGSAPWVLTRATDNNTAATLGRYWSVTIVQGTQFGGGSAIVQALQDTPGAQSFVVGTSFLGFSVMSNSSYSAGPWNTAAGIASVAIGGQATAYGNNTVAIGNTATATGITATALGSYSLAAGQESVTIGHQSFSPGADAVAVGAFSVAYANGQISEASGYNSIKGDAQSCRFYPTQQTTNATPANLVGSFNGQLKFRNLNNIDVFDKTMKIIMTVVARRTDSVGNDAVFTATGYLFGDGSSAYAWNGGAAPTFTKDVSHGTTAGWAVAASVSSNIVTVQVTGAAGQSINWSSKIETIEVAG